MKGMQVVTIASVRTHLRRYVAAAVAVIFAAAFVVVVGLLSSATRNGLVAGVDAGFRGADVVASDISPRQADKLIETAERTGAHAGLVGAAYVPVSDEGVRLSDDAAVGMVSLDRSMRWQQLTSGRFPSRSGEALADVNAARSNHVSLGDEVTVGTGTKSTKAVVVGLADSPSGYFTAGLYVTWPDLGPVLDDLQVQGVSWRGSGDTDSQIHTVRGLLDAKATVRSRADHVDQVQKQVSNGVNVVALVLLLFASIAAFVAVLVIANTFSILITQRLRDLALLRCVGATRRQVLRSVRAEALAMGAGAAAVGLLVGTGIGYALLAVVRHVEPTAPLGSAVPSLGWYAGAFLLGLLTTFVASILPTRRVLQVSPLAALRPAESLEISSPAGRLRLALAAALGVSGVGMLVLAVTTKHALAMIAGGMATFSAVLLLGPVLVPALIRLTGPLVRRLLGRPGRLAVDNAVRNPRRTAATTSALVVGVTLITAILTGLGSATRAVDHEMDRDRPLDASLVSSDPLGAGVLDQVRGVKDVLSVVALPGARARISGGYGDLPVVAPGAGVTRVLHGDGHRFAHPAPGVVWLPPTDSGQVARRVTVTVGSHRVVLRTRVKSGWGRAAVVDPEVLGALGADGTHAVWVRARDDADADAVNGDLSAIAHEQHAELSGGLSNRSFVDLQLRVLTASVLGLLGIAVVIALIGIANTLGLSALERTRENALLRALGMTRRQLRGTMAVEALLLAGVAALLGLAIGLAYAWVGVQTLVASVVPDSAMVLPVGQLVLVVLAAALAGLLACVLPARRAARVTPAAGLTLD